MNIPSPYQEEFENSDENPTPISNSNLPIREDLDVPITVSNSPISQKSEIEPELKYSINDLVDVWVRGCTNGATLWGFCQDNKKELPSTFEYGLELLLSNIKQSTNQDETLRQLVSNNFILLGLFQELLDKKD